MAELSRVSIPPSEETKMASEMDQILEYFKVIDDAPVGGLPPTYHVTEADDALREDEVVPSSPDKILRGVPHRKGRLVRAPRVF